MHENSNIKSHEMSLVPLYTKFNIEHGRKLCTPWRSTNLTKTLFTLTLSLAFQATQRP